MEKRPLESMLDSVDLDEIYKVYNNTITNLISENVQLRAQVNTLKRFLTEEYESKEDNNGNIQSDFKQESND